MDLSLSDKTALITGGYKGIGYGIAEALAQEGCNLVICARNFEGLQKAAENLQNDYIRVLPVATDLTESDDIDYLIEKATDELDTIDILVNNAGTVGQHGTFDGTPMEEWKSLFELNFFAVVELTQKVIPLMQEQGWGRIINVSSENGSQPYPDMMHYNASKGALDNLTKGLSKQYASDGILVNAISPAFIQTPLVDDMMEQAAEEQGISKEKAIEQFLETKRPHIELKRPGTIEEVGAVAAFLASDKASFVNGANYRIDGGSVAAE